MNYVISYQYVEKNYWVLSIDTGYEARHKQLKIDN